MAIKRNGYNTYARDIETWNFLVSLMDLDPHDISGVTEDFRPCKIIKAFADGWQMLFQIRLEGEVISVLPSFVMAAGIPYSLVKRYPPRSILRTGNIYLNHIYTREIKTVVPATHETMVEFRQSIPTTEHRFSDRPMQTRSQWDKWCANSTCIRIGK